MTDDHKHCLVCKHPAPCVHRVVAGNTCAYLADGTKVVVCRDAATTGRAWLEVRPQVTVTLGGGDGLLAPDPPHDPLGLEMCPGITPPQEDDAHDSLDALRRVIADISAGKQPEASPAMWALAERICAEKAAGRTTETDEEWAKRLADAICDDVERERKLQGIFDQMSTHVSLVHGSADEQPELDEAARGARAKKVVAVFAFSVKGYGFGELTFITDQNGQTYIDTECSSRETVKEMLGWLVDNAIIDHETDPERHRKYNEARGARCGEHCRICYPEEAGK